MLETRYKEIPLPEELKELLASCRSFLVPRDRSAVLQLAMGNQKEPVFESPTTFRAAGELSKRR